MMEVTRCNYYHATISLTVSCDASDSFLLPANKGVWCFYFAVYLYNELEAGGIKTRTLTLSPIIIKHRGTQ